MVSYIGEAIHADLIFFGNVLEELLDSPLFLDQRAASSRASECEMHGALRVEGALGFSSTSSVAASVFSLGFG